MKTATMNQMTLAAEKRSEAVFEPSGSAGELSDGYLHGPPPDGRAFLGFRVTGQSRGRRSTLETDMFALRQSAIECAQRLKALGWVRITCDEVTEVRGVVVSHAVRWEAF